MLTASKLELSCNDLFENMPAKQALSLRDMRQVFIQYDPMYLVYSEDGHILNPDEYDDEIDDIIAIRKQRPDLMMRDIVKDVFTQWFTVGSQVLVDVISDDRLDDMIQAISRFT